MFRTIIFFIRVAFSLLINLFTSLKARRLRKKGKMKELEQYAFERAHNWAKFVMKCAKANIKINGIENIPKDKTVLFVANHQSNFDIPLLLSVIDMPIGFIAKSEMTKLPVVAPWMRNIGCVFMDRNNMRKSAEAIVDGIKNLKNNHSMVIFPEGTRSKGGPAHDFKAGSFKLATKAKVDIVPITINGTYKAFEANNNRIKPADIELTIHPAISTADLSKEEQSELHTIIEKLILDDLN